MYKRPPTADSSLDAHTSKSVLNMAVKPVYGKLKGGSRTWAEEVRYYAKHFHLLHVIFLVGAIPTYFYSILHVPLQWRTFLLTGVFYLAGGMGITAG